MESSETLSGVLEFFASYRQAFETYDTESIIAHYCFPCQIISGSAAIVPTTLNGPEQCRAGVDYVLSLHREIGVRSGRPLSFSVTEFSPRLAGMTVRYQMTSADGTALYEFQGSYSLVRTDAGYRIAGICYSQIPRLLACAGRASVSIS